MINYKKYILNPCKFEFMKKITTLIIACLLMGSYAKAQYVNIPDSNFRKYLINQLPSCFNGAGQMDTTCSGVLNENVLDCSNDSIKDLTGIQYFKGLLQLYCKNNQLTFLPPLPVSINYLYCDNNQLTSLPYLPNIVGLYCTNNQLTSLFYLPNTLQSLYFSGNPLTCLQNIPNSLLGFDVWSSNVKCLPNYTSYATFEITNLPLCPSACPVSNPFVEIPDSNFRHILKFYFPNAFNANNQMDTTNSDILNTTVMSFSQKINTGNTGAYGISGLQYFKNLKSVLFQPINSYSAININNEELPNSLTDIKFTGLSSINFNNVSLPTQLENFSAYSCEEFTLPKLPTSLKTLSVNSTKISCLPLLPDSLQTLDITGSGVSCIPNIPNTYLSITPSKPLCNATNNPNNCTIVTKNYVNIPDSKFGQILISKFPDCLHKDSAGLYWMDTTCAGVLTTDSLSTYYTMLDGSAVDTIRFDGLQYFKNLKYFYVQPMLHVSHVVIDNNVLPNGIKTLQFSGLNAVIFNTSKLPDSLINFTNNSCNQFLGSNVVFPSGFKNFSFSGTRSLGDWINGNTYPDNLETFLVRYLINYSPLTNLPNNLKTFEFNSCWGVTDFSYMNLPAGLQNLSFTDANRNVNTNTITLPKLPASLKTLNLNSTKTSCLPLLPDSLQTLDITGASVSCISKIPNAYLSITPSTPLCNATNDSNSCTVFTKNYVNIPDSNFRKYLITQIPACFNWAGQLDTTCSGVDSLKVISCGNMNITDLTGVSYFKNLDTLNCNNNLLSTIPPIAKTIKVLFASYNQLTSLPSALPDSLHVLLCNNNKLSSLPTIPANVSYLSCENNQLTSLPQIPDAVGLFLCENNQLTSIPNIPKSIGIFTCDHNQLTFLPPFPATDVSKGHNCYFSATGNKNLTCLPKLPNNFRTVRLDSTGITCLPNALDSANITPVGLSVCSGASPCALNNLYYVNIPDSNFRKYLITQAPACFNKAGQLDTTCSRVYSLKVISCSNMNIADLTGVSYFKNLVTLNCPSNLLTTLPSLPNTIKSLTISNNPFTSLPALPDSLLELYIYNTNLTSLPPLPDSLQYLYCEYNPLLTTLPSLPSSLLDLYCRNNNLTSLPKLPDSLVILRCDHNNLEVLPALPNYYLKTFSCEFNKITVLPNLSKYIMYLSIGHNPISMLPALDSLSRLIELDCLGDTNLFCLPKLPGNLRSLNIDISRIKCLPNYPLRFSFKSTGVPLCNPTNNANQCKPFPTVMGKVFGDDNSNGIKDSNEQYIPFVQVKLSNGAIVYTNNAGQYTISTSDTGSFSLSVTAPPNYKVLPTNTNFTFSDNNSFLTLSDIALQPTALVDSLAINIETWNVAVPGRSIVYSIDYRNMGTSTTGSTISFSYDTSKLIYDNAYIPSVTKNGNTLTWSDTLTPNYFGSRFYNNGYSYPYFTFTVKPSVHLGDSINSVANIASAKAKATNGNTLIARSSFDPNSKEATLQLSTKQVMEGEMIDYHVHFQNLGNASARNIVIADTLSPLLTQGLLQMMGSSHNPNITFKNNIIYFEFLNIELPDSGTNQLKSNGFVHFKVKPVTTLSEGTNIENKASIYFDYNSPIVTNIASTLIKNIVLPVSLRSYEVKEVLGSKGQIANNWTAANELNVAYYNVQRSIDATNFSNIGQVAAKGNGGYSFLDLNAGSYAKYKTIYYRLQILDKDGSIRYSKTISVEFTVNRLPLTVFPNPSKSFIIINGKGVKEIRLIDNLGRVVLKRTSLNVNDAQQRIDFKLNAGIYMAQILSADGTVKSEKVVVE